MTEGEVTLITLGDVITITHQSAHHRKNRTIDSLHQIEFCENKVDDRSMAEGGSQHVNNLDKHKVTGSTKNALPCIPLRPCKDNEWKKTHHAIITSDKDLDQTVFDCEGQLDNEMWFYAWP